MRKAATSPRPCCIAKTARFHTVDNTRRCSSTANGSSSKRGPGKRWTSKVACGSTNTMSVTPSMAATKLSIPMASCWRKAPTGPEKKPAPGRATTVKANSAPKRCGEKVNDTARRRSCKTKGPCSAKATTKTACLWASGRCSTPTENPAPSSRIKAAGLSRRNPRMGSLKPPTPAAGRNGSHGLHLEEWMGLLPLGMTWANGSWPQPIKRPVAQEPRP